MTLNDYLNGITGADRAAVEAAKKRDPAMLRERLIAHYDIKKLSQEA